MTSPKNQRLAFPLLVILALALLLATWKHWAEFWGDSGANLYTFWQIAEGKVLYRDVFYFHGPLAPVINGWAFRFLGQSVLSIALFNFLLTLGILALIYRWLSELFDGTTALLCGFYFLCSFAIAQTCPSLSFNFIMPYKPEAVFGVLFAFLAFFSLHRWVAQGKRTLLPLVGACWGACLLLSVEIFAAISFGLAVSILGLWKVRCLRFSSSLSLAAGFLAPLLGSVLYFWRAVDFSSAWKSTLGAVLIPLRAKEVFNLPIYRDLSGLEDPLWHSMEIAKASLVVAGICLLLWLSAPLLARRGAALFLGAVIAIFTIPSYQQPDPRTLWWVPYEKIFPVALLVYLVWQAFDLRKLAPQSLAAGASVVWLGFLAFAFALIGKMLLNPQTSFYGFFLAAPGAMALAVFFTCYLPRKWESRPGAALAARALFATAIFSIGISNQITTQTLGASQTFALGTGADQMLAHGGNAEGDGGVIVGLAMRWMEENVAPDEAIALLPESDVMNYLSRRPRGMISHASGFLHRALGEDFLLADLQRASPRYVGFVSNSYSNMGYGIFGVDPNYGRKITDWVFDHYELVKKFGSSPFQPGYTGVWIYRRK